MDRALAGFRPLNDRAVGGLHRALAGSISTELIHYSHVPVVVVPMAAHELVPDTTPALNAGFIG